LYLEVGITVIYQPPADLANPRQHPILDRLHSFQKCSHYLAPACQRLHIFYPVEMLIENIINALVSFILSHGLIISIWIAIADSLVALVFELLQLAEEVLLYSGQ